jgi:cell division protein FtsB
MGRRILFWCLVAAVAIYAVQGGEWGTDDILAQRSRAARLRAEVDSLRRVVDSLTRVKTSILTDAAVQERIAREEFGMVRGDKELLYRFTNEPDTTRRR